MKTLYVKYGYLNLGILVYLKFDQSAKILAAMLEIGTNQAIFGEKSREKKMKFLQREWDNNKDNVLKVQFKQNSTKFVLFV